MINCIYYHGSKKPNISNLKINWENDNPFGPAIYLTKDPKLARCYCRKGGAIYEVRIFGNAQFTVNLDENFICQSAEAKDAILKSLKLLNQPINTFHSKNARDVIQPNGCSKSEMNDALYKNGIWLLYGNLSAMEDNGLMDRGCQFAIIDELALKVTKETNFDEVVGTEKC